MNWKAPILRAIQLSRHALREDANLLVEAVSGRAPRFTEEQRKALEAAHAGVVFSAMPSMERGQIAATIRAMLEEDAKP